MANIQGFGIQLATGGFSLEANTIFESYALALAYAQSSAAYVGKVISVTGGAEKGIYSIEAVGTDAALKKVGSDVNLDNYVTKGEISSVYKAKGSVATYTELPVNAQPGDVYNVIDTGKNFVWVENLIDGNSGWDDLAGFVDLSPYALKAEVQSSIAGATSAAGAAQATANQAMAGLSGKVDKQEGYSLISEDQLTLLGTIPGAITSLQNADSGLDTRLKTIESAFTGEGGKIDLGDLTAQITEQGGKITALESDNTTNKQNISDLQTQVGGHATRLTAIEALNAEQSTQLQSLTERVVAVEAHGTAITNLTAAVNKNTDDIGKINTAIAGLAVKSVKEGEKVILVDENGALGTNLSMHYDSDNHKIQILSNGTEEVAFLDATEFIKDGMLDSVAYDPATKKLTLTWNTAAGKDAVNIDLAGLVDTYTAGSGLSLTGNQFSVAISASANNKLTLVNDGLMVDLSSDIAAINKSVDDKIDAAFAWHDVTASQE